MTATDAAFPVTIEHKFGETVIPDDPQRVVSVGFNDQDALLALGVIPIGIRDWYGDFPYAVWPWAQDELGDAEPEVLPSTELNFEQVAALGPDLIVGVYSGMTETDYAALSAIAPTIAQPAEYIDYGTPWQVQTRMVGEAVGKSAEAEAAIAATEAAFAQARSAHPEFEGATAVVAFGFEGQVGGYSSGDVRGQLLTSLGFTIPDEIESRAGDQFYVNFSLEEIGLLDADVVVWITGEEGVLEEIKALPLHQQMRAAREGREVFLTDLVLGGAASFSSVLSLPFLLDALVPQMATAIDGDPATN